MKPRFFVDAELSPQKFVALRRDDAHHAISVLRSKPRDPLTVIAGGISWDAEFESVGSGEVTAIVIGLSADQSGELPADVTVLQALTKGAKFDEVVEKTVELGAVRIVPVIYSRSESQGSASKVD